MAVKKWVPIPRGTKRRCPKCHKDRVAQYFRKTDPDGFCYSCRVIRDCAVLKSESESLDSAGEIKLGQTRVLRIRVVGDVVALVSGSVVARNVRESSEMLGGDLNHKWKVVNGNPTFRSECSTLTVPLRFLDKLRAALAQVARDHPARAVAQDGRG